MKALSYTLTLIALGARCLASGDGIVVRRDATTLHNTLNSVRTRMIEADNQLEAYYGGSPTALRDAAQALYESIDDGAKLMREMNALSLEDVQSISSDAGQLSAAGTKFLTDLGAAAPVFGAHGLCGIIYKYSLHLGRVSEEFFEAAKDKFPAEGQEQADEEIQHNKEIFAQCQAALAPGACVDLVPPPTSNHNFTEPNKPHTTSVSWQTPAPKPPGQDGDNRHPTPITGAASILDFSVSAVVLASVALLVW